MTPVRPGRHPPPGVGPAVATEVRSGAQIEDEFFQALLDQVLQPGPILVAVRCDAMFHHVVIDDYDPISERCAESVYVSTSYVEIRDVLRKPGCRSRNNRVP